VVKAEALRETAIREAETASAQLQASLAEAATKQASTTDQLAEAVARMDQLTQQLESQKAACLLHSEEIESLKELLQEARHERSAQLQKSADKYHKLAILHDELKEELREERAKVALGLKEMDQLQKENQLFSPALGKVFVTFFYDFL